MKVETLRKIAKEYRLVADRKLDDAEICKGFSELCREEGIAWVQLRALVDAQAKDARDGKDRAGAIVEKAGYASAYADILGGHSEDERKREIRSSSDIGKTITNDRDKPGDIKSTVSIAAGTPHVAERPSHDDEEPSPEPAQAERTQERELSAAPDPGELPSFLDRRSELVRS